jgi:5-methylcytosine-specific restriction enzyme A
METALFINGIYESVLVDIIDSQERRGGGTSYLQPYKRAVIRMLSGNPPSADQSVRLFISLTHSLSNISYSAEIVRWEDKRELSPSRRAEVIAHLTEWQEGEINLFNGVEQTGADALNLLTIRNLRRCDSLLPTSILRKVSDDLPLKPRSRAGGWSEVFDDVGDSLFEKAEPKARYERDLAGAVGDSLAARSDERKSRLAAANPTPERIQLISTGFRRNPDVIAEVLLRANGVCERCKKPAPFRRKSDGSPFLEVHHWKPLGEGGEDVVSNAGALCPNCHREFHFG